MRNFFGFESHNKSELDHVGSSIARSWRKLFQYNQYDVGYALFRAAIVFVLVGAMLALGGLVFGAWLSMIGLTIMGIAFLSGVIALLLGRNSSGQSRIIRRVKQ
jgi:hypothetical protein